MLETNKRLQVKRRPCLLKFFFSSSAVIIKNRVRANSLFFLVRVISKVASEIG